MNQKDLDQLRGDIGLLAAILAKQFPEELVPKALESIADRNLPHTPKES